MSLPRSTDPGWSHYVFLLDLAPAFQISQPGSSNVNPLVNCVDQALPLQIHSPSVLASFETCLIPDIPSIRVYPSP